MKKICPICGDEFECFRQNALYCSLGCKRIAARGYNREADSKRKHTVKPGENQEEIAQKNKFAVENGLSYGKAQAKGMF